MLVKKWMTRATLTLGAAMLAAASGPAAAAYPERMVRVVVPFAAGGGVDALARPFAKELSQILGQSVVVENKPSNTGQIGATDVARATPDGYTLLLSSAAFATTPAFYPSVPYNPINDFSPVMIMAAAPQVVVANNDFKAKNIADVIEMVKRQDRVNVALSGSTGMQSLATEKLAAQAGISFMKIPYKGAGAAFIDLISGEVDMMIDNPASSLVHVRSGKLKVLATTGTTRMPILPDVPTVAETLPGFEARNWFVLAAPKGTPPEVIATLNSAAKRALETTTLRDMMARDGTDVVAGTPEEATAFLKSESATWAKVVKDGNLQP
ncbi:MAG: tripartite tricarboxylate transporter substrate binding protein [Burkholderiaceae bacterium]